MLTLFRRVHGLFFFSVGCFFKRTQELGACLCLWCWQCVAAANGFCRSRWRFVFDFGFATFWPQGILGRGRCMGAFLDRGSCATFTSRASTVWSDRVLERRCMGAILDGLSTQGVAYFACCSCILHLNVGSNCSRRKSRGRSIGSDGEKKRESSNGENVNVEIFKSGRRKGALKLVCRSFFKRETRCWLTQDFDMSRFPEIPKPMRDLYQNLEMSFERNARQGSWEMHMETKRVHETLFHLLLNHWHESCGPCWFWSIAVRT